MLSTPHHRTPGWGRSSFSLLSVLALLAFACFPIGASADSSAYEYENAIPSPTGGHGNTATPGGSTGGTAAAGGAAGAAASNATGAGTASGDGAGKASAGKDGSTGGGKGAGKRDGGNGSSTSQPGGQASGSLSNASPLPGEVASSESGGGSSPLVPILIVIAILGAISVGVVMLRQRRQQSGSPVSPKAS
jgi:cobalamin biosynthesis Mg chelatase CobN